MREETKVWVRKAEGDRRSAEILGEKGEFDNSCYHYQHCAEKVIKAVTVELTGREPRHVYDISLLLDDLEDIGVTLPADLTINVRSLTSFANKSIYPGYDCTAEDVEMCKKLCDRIYEFCVSYLEG